MKLIRIPNSRELHWGSAWWEAADLPGIIVYKDRFPVDEAPGWRIEHSNSMPGWAWLNQNPRKTLKDLHPYSWTIARRLEGQVFSTRREALQAIEVALMLFRSEVEGA